MAEWIVGQVSIATKEGRVSRACLVRNGLSLDERGPISGEPQWALSHLGTGLQVCMLEGQFHEVLPAATELADCFDWVLPAHAVDAAVAAKVREIGARYSGIFYRQGPNQISGMVQ